MNFDDNFGGANEVNDNLLFNTCVAASESGRQEDPLLVLTPFPCGPSVPCRCRESSDHSAFNSCELCANVPRPLYHQGLYLGG